MGDNNLILSDDEAKAARELARFGTRALETVEKGGAYIDRVLGALPANVIGIAGDWVEEQRARIRTKMKRRTKELHEQWGTETPIEPSPSIAIPLLTAAQDESREQLQEIWARLLAAAVDPARASLVTRKLIEVVSRMEPLDTRVLQFLADNPARPDPTGDLRQVTAVALAVRADEVEVSFLNLSNLRCLDMGNVTWPTINALGRELMRAVAD